MFGFLARQPIWSVPAAFTTTRRTSNDPDGPLVSLVPRAETLPLCRIFQRQFCPLTLLSTSPSTSMRPFSGLALSFQSERPEQLPSRMTSSSLR